MRKVRRRISSGFAVLGQGGNSAPTVLANAPKLEHGARYLDVSARPISTLTAP